MYVTAYNSSKDPVVVDASGHTLGGEEWGTVDSTSDEVKAAADSGKLHLFPNGLGDSAGQAKEALEAAARTDLLTDRAKQWSGASKEALVLIATDAGFKGADSAHKDDLVEFLTPKDIDPKASIKAARETLKQGAEDAPVTPDSGAAPAGGDEA